MSSRPKKGRRACDQTYRRQARREKALLRREKDVKVYDNALSNNIYMLDIDRVLLKRKHKTAVYEVERLNEKLSILSLS